MALIEIKDLNFSYKNSEGQSLQILNDLNLSVEAGELIAIQGPSGSGKSTLLYVIAGLLKFDSGSVKIKNLEIKTLDDEQMAVMRNRTIGFVFQQFYLLPKSTVLENVMLPSFYPSEYDLHAPAGSKAHALLKDLGLDEKAGSYPNQLSGGQQQRVAIGRALINNPEVILADEPTGSLDTKNSAQIIDLLRRAHSEGRTIIIITHDPEVAAKCDKVVHFRDGKIVDIVENRKSPKVQETPLEKLKAPPATLIGKYWKLSEKLMPQALLNLWQNRTRTMLTMLGIIIGIASVLSMTTIGSFTKMKILDSYTELGVNTFRFNGRPNWDVTAMDQVKVYFWNFDWKKDLVPLKKVFPQISGITPTISSGWETSKITYAGVSLDSETRLVGINEEGLRLMNRNLLIGNNFSSFHMVNRAPVCIIGFEIFQRLFKNTSPIGNILYINQGEANFGCTVTGVLTSQQSNKEGYKPDLQVFVPFEFYQAISTDSWGSRIRDVILEVHEGEDVEKVSQAVKAYFDKKYGKAGRFTVGTDSILLAQMNKFLNLFTLLLGAIAMVSLTVGGIGITNMMLVSISERLKEIGIRKAFGATHFSVRVQFLLESILICLIAGVAGLIFGFAVYQGAIFGASKFIPKMPFEWYFNGGAILLSVISILVVGILSGLIPAFRAEKLQVIEALRNE